MESTKSRPKLVGFHFWLTDYGHVGELHQGVVARRHGNFAQIRPRLLHLDIFEQNSALR